MLSTTGEGMVILGALQTEPTETRRVDQEVVFSAGQLRLRAAEVVSIQVGESRLELRSDGQLTLVGERLSMDVSRLIKLLSQRVELP